MADPDYHPEHGGGGDRRAGPGTVRIDQTARSGHVVWRPVMAMEIEGSRTMEYLSQKLAERLADLEHDDLVALLLHGSGAETKDPPGHLMRIAALCKACNTCALILALVKQEVPIPLDMIMNLSVMAYDAGINLP